jgi:hypothetical protein
MTRRAAALAVLAVAVACGRGEPRQARIPATLSLPCLAPSPDAAWTGRAADEPIVASVDGIPVPAGRLRRALVERPDLDAAVAMRAVVAQEVLAQQAARAEPEGARPSRLAWERALAGRVLEDRIARLGTADVPREDLEELWAIPDVRIRFDHLAEYDTSDFQWICCNGAPSDCDSDAGRACFARAEGPMRAVAARLAATRPDPDDFPVLLDDLRELAPGIALQDYTFMYDTVRRIQRGRSKFDTAVVNAAVDTGEGRFSDPVRSAFGWHVVFVRKAEPEEHRTLWDPVVSADLAKTFLPRFKRKQLFEYLGTVIPARLPGLARYFGERTAPDPLLPVELFPGALRDALEEQAHQKEKREM